MADSYEVDFHPVGEGARSGEAISGKFIIDCAFQKLGTAIPLIAGQSLH